MKFKCFVSSLQSKYELARKAYVIADVNLEDAIDAMNCAFLRLRLLKDRVLKAKESQKKRRRAYYSASVNKNIEAILLNESHDYEDARAVAVEGIQSLYWNYSKTYKTKEILKLKGT